jgi:crotonobetainyl-CoA:carnitine CoA-transferase CaiB-like acyl-CoA transferase
MKMALGPKDAPGPNRKDGTGPLAGIQVLDLSAVVSGPLCGQVLGDLGADVIKVEPLVGDTTRKMGPPFKAGFTGFFSHFNRNKRSLAVDLKTDDGRAVVQRLARDADVLIQNFRPGVAERIGIGYEALAKENPRLIYVAISGFGPDGPYRDLPAYDSVIQGLSGFMAEQGGRGGEPKLVSSLAADKSSAFTAMYAVLAALFARERSGEGQLVEVPMLDAYIAFMMPDILVGETFQPKDEQPDLPPLHRTWETQDGHVVMMVIENDQFQGMCRALDREDLIDDPRCANLLTRITHMKDIFGEMETELRKWPTAELIERARKFGAPVAPANDLQAMMNDPQVKHSEVIVEAEHPSAGTMLHVANPVRFGATPTSMRHHPPLLAENSDEVLAEAGFSDEEIRSLRESGAIA